MVAVGCERHGRRRVVAVRTLPVDKRGEVVLARPATRCLEVVPERPSARLKAIEEMGVAVQRLTRRQLAGHELE